LRAGLPVQAPRIPASRWLELMRLDKKAQAGEIRFVVIEAPGRAGLRSAPDALVLRVIEKHSEKHSEIHHEKHSEPVSNQRGAVT